MRGKYFLLVLSLMLGWIQPPAQAQIHGTTVVVANDLSFGDKAVAPEKDGVGTLFTSDGYGNGNYSCETVKDPPKENGELTLCDTDDDCDEGLRCCYPCGVIGCHNACIPPAQDGSCPLFP